MTSFGFRFEPEPSKARALRAAIRVRLAEHDVLASDIDRIVLVIDEIVSNSIEHAAPFRAEVDRLMLHFKIEDTHLLVEFRDPAVPAQAVAEIVRQLAECREGRRPPLEHERGRGLFLIEDAFEELTVSRGPDGLGLRLRGRFPRATA